MSNNEQDVLAITLQKCQEIVGKNVELEKKLKIAEQTMFDVGFWLSSFVASLNSEYSEYNKSLPIGNFEQAIKTQADALRKAIKKIKEQPDTLEEMKTTCDICGKEIVGIDNFIDAGDKVVCSRKCLETAISEFYHWQNTKG